MKSIVSSWIVGGLILLVFSLGAIRESLTQDVPPVVPPPAATETAPPAPPSVKPAVPLKPEDAKDLEIIKLKFINLELERRQINTIVENQFHFTKRQNDLLKTNSEFTEKMIKDYSIDRKKFRLDADAAGFVPIPVPPAPGSVKPAAAPTPAKK